MVTRSQGRTRCKNEGSPPEATTIMKRMQLLLMLSDRLNSVSMLILPVVMSKLNLSQLSSSDVRLYYWWGQTTKEPKFQSYAVTS